MKNKFLVGTIVAFGVFCLSPLSFATPAEDSAVEAYKSILQKAESCTNWDEFEKFNRETGAKEKLAELDAPGAQAQMQMMPKALKEGIFNMMKSTFFDISELEIKGVSTQGDIVTINYGRKGHPDLQGEATLKKEEGSWKLIKDSKNEGVSRSET